MTEYVVITAREGRHCTWCDRARALLTAKGLDYTVIPLTDALMPLFDAMGFKTVPQVFRRGQIIGGFEALESYMAHRARVMSEFSQR